MKLAIIPQTFYRKTAELLQEIDSLCEVLCAKIGTSLNLRQVYYQLVARNRIPNNDKAYKNLINVVRDGRYAGALDWEHITDRVRVIHDSARWQDAEDRLVHAAETHRIDTWESQRYRPEVWIEKDALLEIANNACSYLDVQYMSVKAYSSVSALWDARCRFREYARNGQTPVILHLGDHDCTGVDCSRFLQERMELLVNTPEMDEHVAVEVRRLALNMDQIHRYELPPQPGKIDDPRYDDYVKRFGTEHVWELDALSPEVIVQIIEDGIRDVMDDALRQEYIAAQEEQRDVLTQVGENYQSIAEFIEVVCNGHRDSYEAWKAIADNSLDTEEIQNLTKVNFQNLTRVNFHRPAAPATDYDRDAKIAGEYARRLHMEGQQ